MIALLASAALAMVLVMSAAWAVQRGSGNAGWVDMFWSAGTGAIGAACALVPISDEHGDPARRVVVAGLALLWAARLALHIAARTARGPEDSRYAAFRREWGAQFQRRMFVFLMVQAAAAVPLVLAFAVAAHNPAPFPRSADLAGIAVALIAIGGEALADAQLRRFRGDPAHRGRICDVGLWAWSRHPNYFFEWLIWLGYPLLAIDIGGADWAWGWLALGAPALMYWLLVHVSGIPPLEAQMRTSRGAAWDAYAARTSAFVPLPPPIR